MKPGGGKAKGSAYEREIAKKISLFLTEGKNPDTVWRSSNSGGKATVTKSMIGCGDLQSISEESKKFFSIFSLELKNYKELNLLDFQKENFILNKWWEQASTDAKRANKIPLLIIRISRKGDFVCWDNEAGDKIAEYFNVIIDSRERSYFDCSNIKIANKKYILSLFPVEYFFGRLILSKVT